MAVGEAYSQRNRLSQGRLSRGRLAPTLWDWQSKAGNG